jgi:hypothetical protein
MRITLLIFIFFLSALNPGTLVQSNASATQVQPRYIRTSSALIIVVRHPADHALRSQRYGGFSPRYKIGPYIRPTYSQDRARVNEQRYSGFKRVYKRRCRRCQRYSGFKKTYSGRRYTGFTEDYPQSRYLDISYYKLFRTY